MFDEGGPDINPPPPQAPHARTIATISPAPQPASRKRMVPIEVSECDLRAPHCEAARPDKSASIASTARPTSPIGLPPGGSNRPVFSGTISERAVVLTVTEMLVGAVPDKFMALGETVQ